MPVKQIQMYLIAKMQALNRIAIPKDYVEVLKLKEGDKVRVTVEKVRT